MSSPSIAVHCDWSTDPRKRWMAIAHRSGASWRLSKPERADNTANFFAAVRARVGGEGAALFGFDFPVGIAEAYGQETGFKDFATALRHFGSGDWSEWYSVCERRDEISVRRPFYPMRPGGTKLEHLILGLGHSSKEQLLRQCERATSDRNAACAFLYARWQPSR
jgi:hypothetical protein